MSLKSNKRKLDESPDYDFHVPLKRKELEITLRVSAEPMHIKSCEIKTIELIKPMQESKILRPFFTTKWQISRGRKVTCTENTAYSSSLEEHITININVPTEVKEEYNLNLGEELERLICVEGLGAYLHRYWHEHVAFDSVRSEYRKDMDEFMRKESEELKNALSIEELKDKYYRQPHVGYYRHWWRESKLNDDSFIDWIEIIHRYHLVNSHNVVDIIWSGYQKFLHSHFGSELSAKNKLSIAFMMIQLFPHEYIINKQLSMGFIPIIERILKSADASTMIGDMVIVDAIEKWMSEWQPKLVDAE